MLPVLRLMSPRCSTRPGGIPIRDSASAPCSPFRIPRCRCCCPLSTNATNWDGTAEWAGQAPTRPPCRWWDRWGPIFHCQLDRQLASGCSASWTAPFKLRKNLELLLRIIVWPIEEMIVWFITFSEKEGPSCPPPSPCPSTALSPKRRACLVFLGSPVSSCRNWDRTNLSVQYVHPPCCLLPSSTAKQSCWFFSTNIPNSSLCPQHRPSCWGKQPISWPYPTSWQSPDWLHLQSFASSTNRESNPLDRPSGRAACC